MPEVGDLHVSIHRYTYLSDSPLFAIIYRITQNLSLALCTYSLVYLLSFICMCLSLVRFIYRLVTRWIALGLHCKKSEYIRLIPLIAVPHVQSNPVILRYV